MKFKKPGIPVYANAEATPYPEGATEIKKLLTKQLNHSVRFVEQIENMYKDGARVFIEVGPGNVLTNLVRKILSGKPHKTISLDNKNTHGLKSMWKALGELAVESVGIDFSKIWQDFAPCDDPREKEKPTQTKGFGPGLARRFAFNSQLLAWIIAHARPFC